MIKSKCVFGFMQGSRVNVGGLEMILVNWGPPHLNGGLEFTVHCLHNGKEVWATVINEVDFFVLSLPQWMIERRREKDKEEGY